MSLCQLQEDVKAHVLAFCTSREVESMTVADSHVARHVLPASSLWKNIFIRRWNALNYRLDLEHTDIVIDDTLKTFFPINCSESRMYQLLAHAITPVPSYVDLDATNMYSGFGRINHRVQAVETEKKIQKKDVTNFEYVGRYIGGDRSVRSNVQFSTLPRVVVYQKAVQNDHFEYRIGLISTGYYEMTIKESQKPLESRRLVKTDSDSHLNRKKGLEYLVHSRGRQDMASIGVATYRFHLVDKQPGWDQESYGYHGDDGKYFHQATRGKQFGPSFGAGDTIGCGIRQILKEQRSELFFTINGKLIMNEHGNFSCVYAPLFAVIGIDCSHQISVNYGQKPFAYECIDEFFQETSTIKKVRGSRLQWFSISDSDTESENMSDDDDDNDSDDNQNEEMNSDDSEYGIYEHTIGFFGVPGLYFSEYDDDDDDEDVFEDEDMSE